ncbi:olfactory receptor 148-like [Simochromis diagramma]|uniref:olfactory receptor 148-like n=1 Tax=Simochromis diagramma TaxID=43689 RepID=UPI001A7ED391|nr:olfactory receptor 148-like [Simochromis diagramma]
MNGFDTVKRPVAVGVVILIIYLVSIVTNLLNILFIISDKRLHKPIFVVLPATVAPLPHCYSSLRYSFCDYAAVVRTTCVDPTYFFNIGAIIYSFLLFLTFIFICLSYCVILIFVKLSSSNDKNKIGSTLVSHLICVICHYCPAFVIIVLTRLGVVITLEEQL